MFILINELLLKNQLLTSDEKIVLCMFNQFRKANAHYWGSLNYMADNCGISVDIVRECIAKFVDMEILVNDHNGYILTVDIEINDLNNFPKPPYRFNNEAFTQKFTDLKNSGYQIIVECDRYIQLVHPDRPGLVMLNK